jgi:hypothetical protein
MIAQRTGAASALSPIISKRLNMYVMKEQPGVTIGLFTRATGAYHTKLG